MSDRFGMNARIGVVGLLTALLVRQSVAQYDNSRLSAVGEPAVPNGAQPILCDATFVVGSTTLPGDAPELNAFNSCGEITQGNALAGESVCEPGVYELGAASIDGKALDNFGARPGHLQRPCSSLASPSGLLNGTNCRRTSRGIPVQSVLPRPSPRLWDKLALDRRHLQIRQRLRRNQ